MDTVKVRFEIRKGPLGQGFCIKIVAINPADDSRHEFGKEESAIFRTVEAALEAAKKERKKMFKGDPSIEIVVKL